MFIRLRFTALGGEPPVILKTSSNAKLPIGNDTGISGEPFAQIKSQ